MIGGARWLRVRGREETSSCRRRRKLGIGASPSDLGEPCDGDFCIYVVFA
uniref:Polished rice ORF5-peptide n=1 Tax=Drosophila melanogaster TaxID=7227 RepID=A4PJ05_DROME|nr:polished rice ORF5-peptide [Drosophila melanogaster]